MIAFEGPGKYVQGSGAIKLLPLYVKKYGTKAFLLLDTFISKKYGKILKDIFQNEFVDYVIENFSGENNSREIERCIRIFESKECDLIVGIGGGKTLDCGKYVGHIKRVPFFSVPTTASTDAPCSALSIVYDGKMEQRNVFRCIKNPDVVLVDTQIIVNAPIRFMVAGIGDAVATYFEAYANEKSEKGTFVGKDYKRTYLVLSVAEQCYEIIKRYAREAIRDAKEQKVTPAVEAIVEANILLSGVGFENGGCAGAHSISAGIGSILDCAKMMHGEKVAYGVLCEMYLEKWPQQEIEEMFCLFRDIGLPTTLEEMGISNNVVHKVEKIAEASMDKFWESEPFTVSISDVKESILWVDKMGKKLMDK